MAMNKINGDYFINMLLSASNNLENKKEEINKSNVFPVPDGDTGTNMSLTFSKAATDILTMQGQPLTKIADTVSSSSLRGARGNSGVILSQFFRGIAKVIKGQEDVDIEGLANAFAGGTKAAYRAVMKPTEGTILTVMKGISDEALSLDLANEDLESFLSKVIKKGKEVLDNTPNLLPKLKEAGVVDSGGMGLMAIFDGMYYYVKEGKILELSDAPKDTEADYVEEIKYLYKVSYTILKEHRGAELLKDKLKLIGDNYEVKEEDNKIFVSVDTDKPDAVLGFGLKIGELININVSNLKYKTEELKKAEEIKSKKERTKYGFVAVAAGDGFKKIYEDLGITGVISGGQSMNPSTDDILNKAIEVNAETVFVFPNNKNIILAANQAKELFEGDLIVIPTMSMAEVFSLMMFYDESMEKEEIEEAFNEALNNIGVAEITYAVRDSSVDGIEIKEGDIMEIVNHKVSGVSKNVEQALLKVVDKIVKEDSEIITLYAGEDIKEKDLKAVTKKIEDKYPDMDVSALRGDQPIYYYIVSAE